MAHLLLSILMLYGFIGLLFFCRLAVAAVVELDWHDWRYGATPIIAIVVLFPLVWPLVFYATVGPWRYLLHPVELLRTTDGSSQAERGRLRASLDAGNSHCSTHVTFGKESFRFTIDSRELAELTRKVVATQNLPERSDESDILLWLQSASPTLPGPTAVPACWQWRFIYLMLRAWEQGKGDVWCATCNHTYTADKLQQHAPPLAPGPNFRSFRCPQGHDLYRIPTVSIMPARGKG